MGRRSDNIREAKGQKRPKNNEPFFPGLLAGELFGGGTKKKIRRREKHKFQRSAWLRRPRIAS